MAARGDHLAGIVDMFGGLTREELRQAVREVAFRTGTDEPVAEEDLQTAIDEAIDAYRLVTVDPDVLADFDRNDTLLVAGPTAFPEVPEGGQDLPLILDIDRRTVDRETIARAVHRRFRTETARALAAGDHRRATTLLDVSYDIESWAPIDLGDVRARLDDALDPKETGAEGPEP